METMTSNNGIINQGTGYICPGKVLLVEDEVACAILVQEILSETPIQVITVHNGIKALETLKQIQDIDVILLDIRLPELSGFEVFKRAREINQTIPIIALTATPSRFYQQRCDQMGFADYILKPFTIEELIRSVNIALLNKYN